VCSFAPNSLSPQGPNLHSHTAAPQTKRSQSSGDCAIHTQQALRQEVAPTVARVPRPGDILNHALTRFAISPEGQRVAG
jgi:hypothetical protein